MIKILKWTFLGFILCSISCKEQDKAQPKSIHVKNEQASISPIKEVKMKDLNIDYCMGKFEPKDKSYFIAIPKKYADREGMYMRQDAFDAFVEMYNDASKEGHILQIRSAARNFDYQKGIWERKWTGATTLSDGTNVDKDVKEPIDKALKILEYSSMPGTSRHHWGTDIDLNFFNNSYFETGKGKLLYEWLTSNAHKYGYCQPYTPKGTDRPDGYNEEKWHWSYTPVSNDITDFAESNLTNAMIKGFLGDETPEKIDVVKKYVLGIHGGCRH